MSNEEEFARCAGNFLHFLKYVRIQEPTKRKNGEITPGGAIPFILWPHLKELTRLYVANRWNVTLKARQVGWSWHAAAWAGWHLWFKPGSLVLMTSKGEVEATRLLGKIRFIHSQLPDFLRPEVGADGATRLSFPSLMSEVIALPSTASAGIGENATLYIADELDFHEYAKENYSLIKPALDAGGQMCGGSTVNPFAEDTLFRNMYTADSGFSKYFISWRAVPGRDDKWLKEVLDNTFDMQGLPRELFRQKNYPENEEEALAPPKTTSVFNHDRLKEMEQYCRKPSQTTGPISTWEDWAVGHIYTSFTDGAHGIGQDESVTVVMDTTTGHVVADVVSNNIKPDEFTWHSIQLLEKYKNPLWAIEMNDPGPSIILKAEELGYSNLFYRDWQKIGKRDNTKKTQPGWHTDVGEHSRVVLWADGMTGIDLGQIVIYNLKGLRDFYKIIRRPDKNNKIMAVRGAHDDYPLAVCGAWHIKKYAVAQILKPIPVRSIFEEIAR